MLIRRSWDAGQLCDAVSPSHGSSPRQFFGVRTAADGNIQPRTGRRAMCKGSKWAVSMGVVAWRIKGKEAVMEPTDACMS